MLKSFVALLLLVPTADPPKENVKDKELPAAAQKELKKLAGKWQMTRGANSKEAGDIKDVEFLCEFDKAEVTFSGNNKKEMMRVTAVDAATDPKCIDLTELKDGKPGRTVEAVYKIDGDTLTIALMVTKGEKQRPVNFDQPKDARGMVWTFKRVKE